MRVSKKNRRIIKKMRRHYFISSILPICKRLLCTDTGLCNWLLVQGEIKYADEVDTILRLIMRANNLRGKFYNRYHQVFWYEPGDVDSRLKLIRKTVEYYNL